MFLTTIECPACGSSLASPVPARCGGCGERLTRCILYARVSTPQQAKLYSLDEQLDEEREYVQGLRNAVPVAEFRDDQSGRVMARDGLQEAVAMLQRGEADALITFKIDRLHRNFLNHVLLRQQVQALGAELHYAQLRRAAGRKAKERLSEDVLALMAEIEADEIAERTQMGLRRKAQAGRWVGYNKPPYGFRAEGPSQREATLRASWGPLDEPTRDELVQGRVSAEVRSVLQAGDAPAAVVPLCFVWYVQERLSAQAIAERLTDWRVPTPMDVSGRKATIKTRGFAQWGRGTVRGFLREAMYRGLYGQHRFARTGKTTAKLRPTDEWIPLSVETVVPDWLWHDAQTRMDNAQAIAARNSSSTSTYLIARLVKCECGYSLRAGKYGRAERSLYKCAGRWKDAARPCDLPSVPVEEADARVWQWVKQELASPERMRRKLEERHQDAAAEWKAWDAEWETATAAQLAAQQEMARLLDAAVAGLFPQSIVNEKAEVLNRKLRELEERLAELADAKKAPVEVTAQAVEGLVEFATRLGERLVEFEDDPEGKREVLEALDVRVRVYRREGKLVLGVRAAGLSEAPWPLRPDEWPGDSDWNWNQFRPQSDQPLTRALLRLP